MGFQPKTLENSGMRGKHVVFCRTNGTGQRAAKLVRAVSASLSPGSLGPEEARIGTILPTMCSSLDHSKLDFIEARLGGTGKPPKRSKTRKMRATRSIAAGLKNSEAEGRRKEGHRHRGDKKDTVQRSRVFPKF